MSIQPTDIAIFLVSFAPCIYCFVLSKRLKALQNTKDGLGATITALSTSISQMSSTTQDMAAASAPSSGRAQRAADQLLAGTLGHVDPCVLLAIGLGCAGTGGIGRLTVVLTGLCDPVALLRLVLGKGRTATRHQRKTHDTGEGGTDDCASAGHL